MKILIEESVVRQALEFAENACGGKCNTEYNPCEARDLAEEFRAALERSEKDVQQKPACYMGTYNSAHIRDMYTKVMRSIEDFQAEKYMPDRIDSLYLRLPPLPAPAPAVPEGWKLVPIEMTGDMAHAAFLAGDSPTIPGRFYVRLAEWWKAMLSAAPEYTIPK